MSEQERWGVSSQRGRRVMPKSSKEALVEERPFIREIQLGKRLNGRKRYRTHGVYLKFKRRKEDQGYKKYELIKETKYHTHHLAQTSNASVENRATRAKNRVEHTTYAQIFKRGTRNNNLLAEGGKSQVNYGVEGSDPFQFGEMFVKGAFTEGASHNLVGLFIAGYVNDATLQKHINGKGQRDSGCRGGYT
ncbi:hypothetical protein VNO78_18645 [Psophocarpus tetragonolobus]|uniref:Uncharacterized protein n=1 Tax=Psophocarpus tetragonolobus TaxID=3891 RepID=A0AAN9SJ74_PSOTE